MNEVIVFLWVAVFSASAPIPGPQSVSSVADPETGIAWTVETCEAHEARIWGQNAETYAASDVIFMFSECFIVIPRPVRQVKQ